MAKKVVWSKSAIEERNQIFQYWNNRNKSKVYSTKLHSLIKEAIRSVAKNPKIGILSEKQDIRIKFVKTYLIIYKEFDKLILIVSIWDGRQNPTKLLK